MAYEQVFNPFTGVVDQVQTGNATSTDPYLMAVATPGLVNSRTATGSSNISLTDNGAGNTFVFDLTNTGVVAGSYTYASITVDAKGRLTAASSGVSPAPTNASFLTLGLNAGLTDERVATGSSNISITDAGPNSTATFDLTNTTVTPGIYTYASITVDTKGRITAASSGATGGFAPANATYLVLSLDATLTDERVATASSNVTITDAGAGSTATFDLSNTTVTPGSYTYASITVDAKGRLTAASSGVTSGFAPADATYLTLSTNATLTDERVATASSNISITDAGPGSTATFDLTNTTVTPGTYTYASITVDAKGRLTAAGNGTIIVTNAYDSLIGTTGTAFAIGGGTIQFQSTNGVTSAVVNGLVIDTVTIDTPQDIRTSASPTFVNATLSARTTGRVAYFTAGGAFTDSASLTFDGSTLGMVNATTSTTGILLGGDARSYRVAANAWRFHNTRIDVIAPTFTATSGSQRSIYSEAINNPSGASTGRAWAFVFYAEARSGNNLTDATSAIVGVEGVVANTNTATVSAISGGIFFNSLGANSTTTRLVGLDVYGADVSGSGGTGATVTEAIGLIVRMGRSSGNTSLGNITSLFGVQHRASTWSGTGHMTNQYGMAYSSGGTMNSVTANNQVRKYVEVPAMPSPGAFTGTTIYGIDFLGTSRTTRDGFRIAGDVEVYSSAANVLSLGTADSLQILRGNIITDTSVGMKIGTGTTQLIGFWNATPVVQNTGWSVTGGYTTDKAFDPESTSLTETARVVGTLVDTLKTYGILGA